MRPHPHGRGTDFTLSRASIDVAAQPIGPLRVDGRLWSLRRPRLSDGPAWRQTCAAEGDRLREVLAWPGRSWEQTISLTEWVERVTRQRQAMRAGTLIAYVLVDEDGRIGGELSFAVDGRTATIELSVWLARGLPRPLRAWVVGSALQRGFSLPQAIDRAIAPVAVTNPGPAGLFEVLGFTREATARELRQYGDGRVDHDIWWLDHDDDLLANLGQVLVLARSASGARRLPDPPRRPRLRSAAPVARVLLRRLRAARLPSAPPAARELEGHRVALTPGRRSTARVDGRDVGVIDLRFDPGSSTVEVWSRLDSTESVQAVHAAVTDVARETRAHRIAWSLRPDSPEREVLAAAGFTQEGASTPPVGEHADHQLWAVVRPND